MLNETVSQIHTRWGLFNHWITRNERQSLTSAEAQQIRQYDGLNRLIQSIDALNNKTTYQYQDQQQCQTITLPNGLIQLTCWDNSGRKSQYQESDSIIQRITYYQRDAVGRLLAVQQPDEQYRFSYYDGQGRLNFTIDPRGYVQEYRYDERGNTQRILSYAIPIQLNPKQLPSLHDLNEEILVDLLNDRHVATIYDAVGQLIYEIDGESGLTQHRYDTLGRRIATHRYFTPIAEQQLQDLLNGKAIAMTAHSKDRSDYLYYDAANQQIACLTVEAQDNSGYLIEQQRDSVGRLQRQLRYATPVKWNADATLEELRPAANAEDAIQHYFYDARNQTVAQVDPENYLTVYHYQANGLKIQTQQFAKPLSASDIAHLPAIKPVTDPEDQTIVNQYDACHRLVQTVEQPINKRKTLVYDSVGNKQEVKEEDISNPNEARSFYYRYNAWSQLTAMLDPRAAVLLQKINANPDLTPQQKTDQIEQLWQQHATRQIYDTSGLCIATLNPLGHKTLFYYNESRQLCVTLNPAGSITTQDYAAFDELPTVTRAYANPLTSEQLAKLSGGFLTSDIKSIFTALQNAQKDRINHYQRDRRGLQISHTNPENYQTLKQYNSFGELVKLQQQISSEQWLTTTYDYEARGLITQQVTDSEGLKLTLQRTYNLHAKTVKLTDERGNSQLFNYDRRGQEIKHTDALQQTRTKQWDAFGRLLTETDRLGNSTHYSYLSAQRKQITATPSGSSTTTQCNIFGQKIQTSDATGAVQQWIYEPGGELYQQIDPLGRITQTDYNLAGQLYQRKASGGLITAYQLDEAGQVVKQTEDPDGFAISAQFSYDSFGQEISRKDALSKLTASTYDRCGRKLTTVIDPQTETNPDGLSLTEGTHYDGLGHKIQTYKTSANSQLPQAMQLNQRQYDSAGRPSATIQDPSLPDHSGLDLRESYTLDAAGNLLAKQDPNQHTTRQIWDALNRQRFQIDPLGAVTEWQYDAEDKVLVKRQYVLRIDPQTLSASSTPEAISAAIKPSASDRWQRHYYDADGKECYQVDNQGRVIERHYNVAGKLIGKTCYATPINVQQLTDFAPASLAKLLVPSAQDRSSYQIFDLAEQLRFSVDAAGYVKEQRFDSNGNITAKIRYSQPIDLKALKQYTPEELAQQLKTSADDRSSYQVFDALNRLVYAVDSKQVVTEYQYDATDNLLQTCRYYHPIVLPATLTIAAIKAAVKPDIFQDRHTRNIYDAAGRCTQTTDSLGFFEAWEYDPFNQCTAYQDKARYRWLTEFDNAGRKLSQQTPSTTVVRTQWDSTNPNRLSATTEEASLITKQVYDNASNVLAVTEAAGTSDARNIHFTYDANNQLTGSTITAVAIDDAAQTPSNALTRPEQILTLTTQTVYDAFRQPVAYRDEAGNWSFKVYDSQGQLAYEVDAKQQVTGYVYNAFNQVMTLTRYATPLAINTADYTTTGLTLADLKAKLVPNPAQDRALWISYDVLGQKIQVQQAAVWAYLPSADKSSGQLSKAQPTQQWQYNAFGELVAERTLLNPSSNQWAIKRTWYDVQGKPLAEADSLGYVTLYERDCDGQVVDKKDYATAVPAEQLAISYAELLAKLKSHPKDRHYSYTYDRLSQLQSENTLSSGEVIQAIQVDAHGKPQLVDQPPQNIIRCYQWDGMGRNIVTLDENKARTETHYDALGRVSYRVGEAQQSEDEQGRAITCQELQRTGYNAFGNVVSQLRTSQVVNTAAQQQAVISEENSQQSLSRRVSVLKESFVLLAEDAGEQSETTDSLTANLPPDQLTLKLYDNRGLCQAEQDPSGALSFFSYTATKQQARQWQWVSGWQDKQPVQRLYQLRWEYDAAGNALKDYRRDYATGKDILTAYQYNAFGEKTAEGADGQQWPVVYRYDQAGQCWATNQGNGVYTIQLYDIRGLQSAIWRSQNKDLSSFNYEELSQLNAWDYSQLQRTELIRDAKGAVLTQKQPAFKRLKPDAAQPLYTVLTTGKQYAADFGAYSLSWPAPDDKNLIATLKLWVKGAGQSNAKTPPLTLKNNRIGTDITAYVADLYEYQINYYRFDPVTQKTDNTPVFQAVGEIPLDTGNTAGSQHTIQVQISDSEIVLTGKTSDANGEPLAGIELLQNGQVIARVAASSTDVPGRYLVDLGEHVSGTYTCKPIYGFVNAGAPISIGQDSEAGFRIQLYRTSLTLAVELINNTSGYSQLNSGTLSWSDLPPGANQLLKSDYGSVYYDSKFQNFITLKLQNFEAVFPNLEADGHNSYQFSDSHSESAVLYKAISNELYALDALNDPTRSWYIGSPSLIKYENEQYSLKESCIPPYLYLIPTTAPAVCYDAIAVMQNGNVVNTLAAMSWMNGMQRLDISSIPIPENYSYQVLHLNSQPSSAPESQPFTIFTGKASPRLIARSIMQEDLRISYNAAPSPEGRGYRVQWELPKDLNNNQLLLNSDMTSPSGGDLYSIVTYSGKAAAQMIVQSGINSFPSLLNVGYTMIQMCTKINMIPLLNAAPYQIDGNHVSHFRFRVLYLSPLPGPVKTPTVQFEYLDTAIATPTWRTLQATVICYGISVNVIELPFGAYSYRLKAFDQNNQPVDLSAVADIDAAGYAVGQFKVGGYDSQCYTTHTPENDEVAYPIQIQAVDRWNNVLQSTDPLGNTTTFAYTSRNLLASKIEPQVTVTHEDGSTSQLQPTTTYGYDACGRVIGVRDANGHVTAHWRNAAGKTIKTLRGDGVYQQFIRDAFGRVVRSRDPQGFTYQHSYDLRDCLIKRTDPCGWQDNYSYNELEQRLSDTNGEGQTTRYDYDSQGHVVATYQPLGQAATAEYDRNGQLLNQADGTAKLLTWQRDYFGNAQTHTDKSGALITYQRNFLQQVVKQNSAGGDHGQHYAPSGERIPVPAQDLTFLYDEAGHLTYQLDDAVQLTTRYHLDPLGRRIGERFIASDGHVYQETAMELDACGRLTRVWDTRIEGNYHYDAKGNRRATQVYYYADNETKPLLQQNWYTYNEADSLLIDQGDLVNGHIQLSPNKGTQLTYNASGWRFQEVRLDSQGHAQTNTLYYQPNGLLDHTQCGAAHSEYHYDKAQRRTYYSHYPTSDNQTETHQTGYNPNGWVTNQIDTISTSIESIQTDTQFVAFDNAGRIMAQETETPAISLFDQLTTNYVGFDELKITEVAGQRQDNKGFHAYSAIMAYYDANGNLASLEGNVKESFRAFITNAEGRIVLKTDGETTANGLKREYYFYDTQGNPVGRFGDLPDQLAAGNPPADVDFDLNFNRVSDQFPPPTPSQYTATDNQSFSDISQIVYGDASFAVIIAEANGYAAQDKAPSGMTLRIPSLVNTNLHNWVGDYAVYNSASIIGSYYPNMPMPPPPRISLQSLLLQQQRQRFLRPHMRKKKHHGFLSEIVEVAVGVVAIVTLQPEIAALLIALPEALAGVIATGIAGMAASIAQQETARALGDQDHFSWKQVWQSGLQDAEQAGISGALGVPNPALKGAQGYITHVEKAIAFNAALQALQLATGQQRKFDWKQVVAASLQAVADAKIAQLTRELPNKQLANATNQIASNFSNQAISQEISNRHFDAELAAADALGSYIGTTVGNTAQEAYRAYQAKRQEQQQFDDWLADFPNRIADQYQSRNYYEQMTYDLAQDLTPNFNAPTSARTSSSTSRKPSSAPKNPSYQQRQAQAEFAKTRQQRWSQSQQQQQSRAASNSSNPNLSSARSSFWQGVDDVNAFAYASNKGFINSFKELADAALHPIQTAENIANGIKTVVNNPAVISEAIENQFTEFLLADELQKAQMLGTAFGSSAAMLTGGAVTRLGELSSSVSFWGRGSSTAGNAIDLNAANHINLLRLQRQLTIEQAQSLFTETGELTQEAIFGAKRIVRGEKLSNPQLLDELSKVGGDINDWGKYATQKLPSPEGNFQMHFYRNEITNEVYYGMDYKAVFDHQGTWNIEPKPNFEYEPPRFNK